MRTEHFVQTFKRMGKKLVGAPPQSCKSADHAILRAEDLGQRAIGVVAISVTGEPEFGEFEPPVVLARYGEVPTDFG